MNGKYAYDVSMNITLNEYINKIISNLNILYKKLRIKYFV